MKTERVICDNCGKDITETGAMPAYRLRLTAEQLEHNTKFVHAVLIYPPLPADLYFCNLQCLATWIEHKTSTSSNSGA